jgi:serine/threonine-protein kinase
VGAAAQIPQPGDTVAGKYLLESMLGRGGMGAVFRARHTLTDRKVALKWMLPDHEAGAAAVQRFLREARAMGRIDHPSVVGVLDVGVEGDAAYLVMELLRGRSLRDEIEASGKLSPREAIGRLLPAMEGLAAAHAAGVVHRDIKPDNLFCVSGGTTKVLDFGVSKLQGDRFAAPGVPGSGSITHTGAMVGTPAYMAPEQVRGDRNLDARTDVWALGAILYEALSGKLPFDHETLGQTIVAIATMAPPRLESVVPGVDVALADAVHRALEKDLAARWPSVEAFATALLPFAEGATFTAPRPTSVRPPAIDSIESDAIAIPRPAPLPTTARTMASGTGREDPNDVHVTVAPSAKTSTTSATPFVSSSANRALPTHGPPWGWIAATGVVVAAVIGGVMMMDAQRTPVAPAPPASVASAPPPIDAGPDAFVVGVAPPPPTTTITLPEPPVTHAQIVEPRASRHAARDRAAAAPPPSTTTVSAPPPSSAAPTGGRTGRLSRDDF